MPANQNNTILLEDILKNYKSRNGFVDLSGEDIFELFTLLQLTKDSELSNSEIEDCIVDGGQDGGIDGFVVIVNDQSISTLEDLESIKFTKTTNAKILVTQSKVTKAFEGKALDKLHISIPIVFDLNIQEDDLLRRFNPKLTEKIVIMRQVWSQSIEKQASIRIDLAYACLANAVQVNSELRSKQDQILQLTRSKTLGIPVSFEFYSAEELLQLYQKLQSTTLPMRFRENPTPIEFNPNQYGYIGVVNLKDYYNFIVDASGTIREFLFDSNVRHYQGEVDVNNGIKNTLETDRSVDFWWLNNGISIIASKCTPYPKVLHLENVQIVNGLQTSYVLGRYYTPIENESRSVLVKVVIIENEDKVTIDKIISSSNRQNPVTPAILRATDDIQRKLEIFFLNKGYFYDRRKNYYKNQNKPNSRIYNIPDAAKAIEAILNFNPSDARSRPTELIRNDSSYGKIFDPTKSFDAYLICCLIYRQVYSFIRVHLSGEEKNLALNFSYHLTRILVSILILKARYTDQDVKLIDVASITEQNFQQAYKFLKALLDDYQKSNPDKNIINIAKSTDFSKAINQKLKSKKF